MHVTREEHLYYQIHSELKAAIAKSKLLLDFEESKGILLTDEITELKLFIEYLETLLHMPCRINENDYKRSSWSHYKVVSWLNEHGHKSMHTYLGRIML